MDRRLRSAVSVVVVQPPRPARKSFNIVPPQFAAFVIWDFSTCYRSHHRPAAAVRSTEALPAHALPAPAVSAHVFIRRRADRPALPANFLGALGGAVRSSVRGNVSGAARHLPRFEPHRLAGRDSAKPVAASVSLGPAKYSSGQPLRFGPRLHGTSRRRRLQLPRLGRAQ